MKRRAVPPRSIEELSSWPTKRLLGRLKSLRKLEESPEQSDRDIDGSLDASDILFKSDPRWELAYRELKSLLDSRENIRSGRTDRLARIKQGKRER